MKRSALSAGLLALALALSVGLLASPAFPQNQGQKPDEQQQQGYSGGQEQQNQQKTKTFTGKIMKTKDGRYALVTNEQTNAGHYLDDDADAEKFDGQKVKVTGVLDVASNTIHVTNITAA